MEKTLVQIVTQTEENYGAWEDKEHWKPKGMQVFTLMADSNDFSYGEEQCIEAIKKNNY